MDVNLNVTLGADAVEFLRFVERFTDFLANDHAPEWIQHVWAQEAKYSLGKVLHPAEGRPPCCGVARPEPADRRMN